MSRVDLTNPVIQSPYTCLQAAGSDGADRTVPGIHLRWDFLRSLGDNHLAKGDYTTFEQYRSTLGFNRPGDYIKIYRTDFNRKYYTTVGFEPERTKEIKTGNTRVWKYNAPVDGLPRITINVTIRFIDYNQYDLIRSTQTTLDTLGLLNKYTGIVEAETDNTLAFCVEYELIFNEKKVTDPKLPNRDKAIPVPRSDVKNELLKEIKPIRETGAGYLRVESVTSDPADQTDKHVSCRKKFTAGSKPQISCENIQYTRFDYTGVTWKALRIYCYDHYIAGTNAETKTGGWELAGNFALTTDDKVKDTRFMPNAVDGKWPKFNDDNPLTGAFTVNKLNYNNRWRRPGFAFNPAVETANDQNGLQHFVHTYLKLSKTDERALASLAADTSGDPTTQDISYVDMIRLMSLDYHLARIFGLGHIDTRTTAKHNYIYCLEYKTFVGLEAPDTSDSERTHIYMTVPVSMENYKLPSTPGLLPLTFGITVDNGTGQPTMLTDAQGYAPFGNLRFVNINRLPYKFEHAFGPFYTDPVEYCLCDETQPIAYGLEYKEISETGYRKPELSSDPDFLDASGLPETIPILECGTSKIFTHQETEEGTHVYSAYAINWFSRVSPLSNVVDATTTFPKKTNLLPPFNFAVQLIQDEDPAESNIAEKTLILTTQAEQQLLATIPTTQDNTLVRVTFDWNHVHHHAHQYADYAEIFFRKQEPLVIKGAIAAVVNLPGNRVQITTTGYQNTSTFPETTVTPAILTNQTARFTGSLFNNSQDNYVIESVSSSGVNPTFIVKKLKKVEAAADPAHPGSFISNETFQSPQVNEHFFVLENMGAVENWDLRHNKQIYLEKFYTNAKVKLGFSATRSLVFDIKTVTFTGGYTNIEVVQPINTGLNTSLTLMYAVKHRITALATNTFIINGDHTADFTNGRTFRVFGSAVNDRLYTVNLSTFSGTTTTIAVNETIPDISNAAGLIEIEAIRSIAAINSIASNFLLVGDKTAELDFAHCENVTESDGTVSRFVVGGINDQVTLTPLLTQNPVSAAVEGTGFIQLNFQNYDLLPHPDAEVTWYKGIVRLRDVSGAVQVYPVTFIGNLTTSTSAHLAIVIQDPGFVPASAPSNTTAADIYTLDLGVAQNANYHPSYKLYLKAAAGFNPVTNLPIPANTTNFGNTEILPVPAEGSRNTYMAIHAYDIKGDHTSFLSNPVVLLAQKITLPVAPHQPTGPFYATRPDFYGKSTYTFDTKLETTDRIPYSVVFYKTSEDRLLDVLYAKTTQTQIWTALNALTDPKAKYDPLLWQVLFSGQNDGANFATYTTTAGSFTWPLPDNPDFYLPYQSNKPLGTENPPPHGYYIFPFKVFDIADTTGTSINFALDQSFSIYGKPMTGKAILKSAIQDAFIPLNEQPPIFSYLKTGKQTSSAKPGLRDASGNLRDPLTDDVFPMIRKYSVGNDTIVRYTDFTLDGASKSLYFYRAVEMDDKFKFSEASLPVGPVLLVNTFPPHQPQIKKLVTRLQDDANNITSSVLFERNDYLENEKITKLEIYRTIHEVDALSIRTMEKVKVINWGDAVIDDFSDVAFPLYGEELYYRLVAIREVEDVEDVISSPTQTGLIVDFPSLPSAVFKIQVVDLINPPPPELHAEIGAATIAALQNVVLKWTPTCYNGTYYLQKLNSSGNWVQLYQVKAKDSVMQYPPPDLNNLPDFTNFPETQDLLIADVNGRPVYHRFRIRVENSSGLFNLVEFTLMLG